MPDNTLTTQDVEGNIVEIIAEGMEGGFRDTEGQADKQPQTYRLATGEFVNQLGDGEFENLQTGMIYRQIEETPEKS
jgi:hypothetical protein